jgi:translocation and assembly module TamB
VTRPRILKIAAALAGLLVALAVTGILVVQSPWFFEKVRHLIIGTVETASGGRVEIGAFRFDWKRLRAEVDGFVIHGTEPAGKPPLLRAGSAAVGLKIISIFKRDFDIQYLDVTDPRIYLIVGADGRTNVPEPKVKSVKPATRTTLETILNLAVGRFNVTRGVFEVESHGKTPFDARGQNLHIALAYDFTGPRYRGAISVQPLDAQWGGNGPGAFNVPLNVALNVTIERNRIGIDSARLTHAASQIDISGAIEDLTSPRGAFRYDARVSIPEVTQIVHVRELRHGVAQVTGSATWTAAAGVALTGKLHAVGVEYSDQYLRLAGFRVDGPVAAGTQGVDAGPLRISGDYVDGDRHTPAEGHIASVALRGKNLNLGGVELAGLGGSFHGEASLRDLNRYTVNGEIAGIEVRPVFALFDIASLPWDGRASGPVHLDGSFHRARDFRAGGNITLSPADRGDPVHGQVAASYIADSGTLDLARSTLALPHSRVDFSGVLGRQLTVHLETSNLNDLLPAFGESAAKLPLKLQNGAMVFDGTVTGKLDSPQIEGHTRATGVVYSGESVDSLEADVTVSPPGLRVQNAAVARGSLRVQFSGSLALDDWKIPDTSQIAGSATIRNAALADVASLANAGANLKDLGAAGTLSGSAQISGTVAEPRVSADLEVAKGSYRNEAFDRLTAHVNYSGRTIAVTAAQIAAGPKQIQLAATFDHAAGRFDTGRLRFQVTTNTIALEQIHTLQEARPDAQGTVQVTAHGDIDLAPPSNGEEGFRIRDLHANVQAKGLQLTGQALGDANLTVDSQNQVLRAHLVSDVAHCDIRGDGQWRLEGDYQGNAVVTFTKLDLAQLRQWISPSSPGAVERFAGSAEGEVRIDGPALKPKAMKAELRIAKFEIGPAPASGLAAASLTIRNTVPMIVRMANSIVTVDTARLTGRSTDISLTGRISLEQKNPLDLRVNGHLDLAMLQDFSRDLVSSGTVNTDATIRGALSSPQVNGRLEFQNAAFNLADVPNGISKAQGVILFTSDRATIQSLKGETGGGEIELTGFTLFGAGPLVFRLHARAREVRIRYPEGVSTVADASLNFTGTEERSMLAGTITILRSGINLQSDFSSLLAKSAQPVHTPSAQPGLLGGMNFDIQIDTSPDIQFQSSLTENLQAEANLKLRGTASNPALLGRINITQGQLTFFGVSYTINQGSIAFYNPVKIEPILNIDLETKARGIDVTLTVSGPATKPTLTPRSDPPLQFNEIVALLATGRTPTSDPSLLTQQSSEPQSWQQIGASALLGQAIANPVAGRLQRFFGVSKLRIDPTLSGVENNPQARLTLEQQVTPNITFTYITNVTSSNPQVIRVEWAFSKVWSAVLLREENGLFGLDFFYKRRFK